MRPRPLVWFVVSVAVSSLAAVHRFGDSSHAIGSISKGGGGYRHPFHLEAGWSSYTLIATAAVIPPYRGNARVVLEGAPTTDYEIFDSVPVIDLKVHRRPLLEDGVFYDLQPRDRLAFWVIMRPEAQSASTTAQGSALALYDTRTNKQLMRLPIVLAAGEEGCHGHSAQ